MWGREKSPVGVVAEGEGEELVVSAAWTEDEVESDRAQDHEEEGTARRAYLRGKLEVIVFPDWKRKLRADDMVIWFSALGSVLVSGKGGSGADCGPTQK